MDIVLDAYLNDTDEETEEMKQGIDWIEDGGQEEAADNAKEEEEEDEKLDFEEARRILEEIKGIKGMKYSQHGKTHGEAETKNRREI